METRNSTSNLTNSNSTIMAQFLTANSSHGCMQPTEKEPKTELADPHIMQKSQSAQGGARPAKQATIRPHKSSERATMLPQTSWISELQHSTRTTNL